jgi:hypothetical protein
MKRLRGRPRTLPDFNPQIPSILRERYAHLVPLAEKAVLASQQKEEKAGLIWLRLRDRYFRELTMSCGVESRLTITEEERQAYFWTKHKGKHVTTETNIQSELAQPVSAHKGEQPKKVSGSSRPKSSQRNMSKSASKRKVHGAR